MTVGREPSAASRSGLSARFGASVFVAALCLLSLGSCNSLEVSHLQDPDWSFAQRGRYAWIEPGLSGESRGLLDPARVDAWVRAAVEDELTRKGYELAPERAADAGFWLRILASVDEHEGSLRAMPSLDGFAHEPTTLNFEQGFLALVIVDPETGDDQWRGIASNLVDRLSSDTRKETLIAEAVRRLLEPLPDRGAR